MSRYSPRARLTNSSTTSTVANWFGNQFVDVPPLSSYESIATATGTGSSTTISFSSIPSGFKHLQIRGIGRSDGVSTSLTKLLLRFNSDSGTNYSWHYLLGDGGTASALGGASATSIELREGLIRASMLANTMSAYLVDILDAFSSSKNKTVRAFTGIEENDTNTASRITITSGLWMNTNAITSIDLVSFSGNLSTSTTFALYGIKEA